LDGFGLEQLCLTPVWPFLSLCADFTPCSNDWIRRVHSVSESGVLLQRISVKGTVCILSNTKLAEPAEIRQESFSSQSYYCLQQKTEHRVQTMFCLAVLTLMFVKCAFTISSYFLNLWTETPAVHKASDGLKWTAFRPGPTL